MQHVFINHVLKHQEKQGDAKICSCPEKVSFLHKVFKPKSDMVADCYLFMLFIIVDICSTVCCIYVLILFHIC